MFLQRPAIALVRRAATRAPLLASRRAFVASAMRRDADKTPQPIDNSKLIQPLDEIKSEEDLLPPGAPSGTIPTDLEQATGLDRLEILGKVQGIDIFDMRPLDASRRGTLDNPIIVKSAGEEQYLGCTGSPADSHNVLWLTCSRERPVERCPECGSVYKMEYVGPQDHGHGHHDAHGASGHDDHGHDDHHYEEPKTFADFVRPEYR